MFKNILEENEVIVLMNNGAFVSFDGSSCIACGLCEPVCPKSALSMTHWSIESPYYRYAGQYLGIWVDHCAIGVECAGDCVGACPVNAISVVDMKIGGGGRTNGGGPMHSDPYCDIYPDICDDIDRGQQLMNWAKNQCNILTPKFNNALQSEAAKWGMTAEVYIADKMSLIASSSRNLEVLGKIASKAGYAGLAYGAYSAAVAVSDGKLTANELIGIASTALGVIAFLPGVGTVVGLGGLAVISAGSLVLGLVSNTDLGKDRVVADWGSKSICN